MTKICATCGARWPDDLRFCPNDAVALRSESATDLVDRVIADRYHVIRRLGQGGMGTVYLAEHVRMGLKVALKVIVPELATNADAVARFAREAKNVASIKHPNVCSVIDFGETPDGVVYLAMEYIEGQTLTEVLRTEGAISPQRAADILQQCADALQAAHDLGIVHRDFKPDNVMLSHSRTGIGDAVKVVDFGIAKAAGGISPEGVSGQTVTRTGLVVGTPEFMSPEQAAGDESDPRSDTYALALVLFRMLTGKMPFGGRTPQESLAQRLTERPLQLADAVPGANFPPTLQAVLDRALARNREDRYPTVLDFAKHASAVLRGMDPSGGLDPSAETSLLPSHETSERRTRWIPALLRDLRPVWRFTTLAVALSLVVLTAALLRTRALRRPQADTLRADRDRTGSTSSATTGDSLREPVTQAGRNETSPPTLPFIDTRADIRAAIRDRLLLFVDRNGRYVAVDPASRPEFDSRGLNTMMWAGDGKKLFAQSIISRFQAADSVLFSFADARLTGRRGSLRIKNDSYSLRCGDKQFELTPVAHGTSKSLLASAEFFEHRWQRYIFAIARDDNARFYIVERTFRTDSADVRLLVGKKGALEEVPLADVISDHAGTVLISSRGTLRMPMRRFRGSVVVDNPEWVAQDRSTPLTLISHSNRLSQSYPGYTDFGLYRAAMFGTPCDGLL